MRKPFDTDHKDEILNKLKSSMREAYSLFVDCEQERTKQQEVFFNVMSMINVGGGMMPKKLTAST